MSALREGRRLTRSVNHTSRTAWRIVHRPAVCSRAFSGSGSSAPPSPSTVGGVRVSTLFTALLALGLGATGLGL